MWFHTLCKPVVKLELLFCDPQHGQLVWPGSEIVWAGLIIFIVGLLVRLPFYLEPILSIMSHVLMWVFCISFYVCYFYTVIFCLCGSVGEQGLLIDQFVYVAQLENRAC
jgi:hypothetical protein